MTSPKDTRRSQLGRKEWIDAALSALATKGFSGMCVEVFPKEFGATKGSFYWHFKDRQDLTDAVLQCWLDDRIREMNRMDVSSGDHALDRLHSVPP